MSHQPRLSKSRACLEAQLSAAPKPPPSIPRFEVAESRPFWSVMIPTYNPPPGYLEQTLRSVLSQAPDPSRMQIEIVDDCSPNGFPSELVSQVAKGRVAVHREPTNNGLAGTWNRCIERARGEWVHILHQDDWVLPEFYSRLESLIGLEPRICAAFSRYLHADSDGHWTSISPLIMNKAGAVDDFNIRSATWVPMQCAAAVVKRSTYERIGGFRNDIHYIVDWEMWCRIAAWGRWGYVPEPGAVYREHGLSETTRLRKSGKSYEDILRNGEIARSHFSRELQDQTASGFRNEFINYVFRDAQALYVGGNLEHAGKLLDSFHTEAMKSSRRRDWLLLQIRVKTKPWRQLLHGRKATKLNQQ